jgi:ankyrin repeat protein
VTFECDCQSDRAIKWRGNLANEPFGSTVGRGGIESFGKTLYERRQPMLHGIMTGADVEASNDDGGKPLHSAAAEGHVEVARLLLDRGMGLYWCDAAQNWPLRPDGVD